jgi:hypothetical protein
VTPESGPRARVLFTRFVRRRNFRGFPFWVSASPETCAQLAQRARAFAAAQGLAPGIHLADCPPSDIGLYREREMLPERPVSFEGKRDFKMVFPGATATEHALFGEVEHWTHVHLVAGMPGSIVNDATDPQTFSHSAAYGFLTSNPSFAGAGLQVEAALHLPALAAGHRIPAVQRALGAMGYDLQPLSLRTAGFAESGYFRLLSRGGMDLPEETLYEHFAAKTDRVLAAENGVLERWLERDPNRLEDRVHRALRLLQEARRMDYAELLSLTSFARIGVYLGILPENSLDSLEALRVRAQPFHLGVKHPEVAPETLDRLRADLSRGLLTEIQPNPAPLT